MLPPCPSHCHQQKLQHHALALPTFSWEAARSIRTITKVTSRFHKAKATDNDPQSAKLTTGLPGTWHKTGEWQ